VPGEVADDAAAVLAAKRTPNPLFGRAPEFAGLRPITISCRMR
jgi:hypothetical protein